MDIVTARSLSRAKLPSCSTSLSPPPPLFHSRASLLASDAVPSQPFWIWRSSIAQLQGVSIQARKWRNLGAIHASKADIPPSSADIAERWLLQPVGDGDTRHIGFKVEMPGAFEIASNEVTVGRLPDKADLVIPVATVSALHARIQKKAGSLLVTDLDSTNGTFIDDKRLRPGVVATALPGSCVTFGDTHLAMFRVSKLEKVEAASEQQSEDKEETERVQKSTEAAT